MHVRKISVALFVCAIAMMVAAKPAAAACSNATLKGVYGYYHGRPGGGSTIKAVVGQFTADGAGNLTASWTLSANGVISTGTTTGTYSISKNCTGTITFSSEDYSPADFSFVFDDGFEGFQMIQTDSETAQTGFGLAQGAGVTCGLIGKAQTYAVNLAGLLYPSLDIDIIVGHLTADGKGNLMGSETSSVDGVISMASVTGTYTENADCTGTAQITPVGSTTMNFNTVLVNEGKEQLLIETDSNTLVAGTAQE